jgi:hypothetical protein
MAARYVERYLSSLGLNPEVQHFRSRRNREISLALSLFLLVLAVLIQRGQAILSFLLFLCGFTFCLLEFMGRSPLGILLWRYPSQNVWTKIPPIKQENKKVILLSHLDSPKMAFYQRSPLRRIYKNFIYSSFVLLILLFMWMMVIAAAYILKVDQLVRDRLWLIALVLSLPFSVAAVSLFAKWVAKEYSPGACDDAAGISILLNLARHYSQRSLLNTELWIVAAGCEEAGSMGLKRFIRAHRGELEDALFINIDAVGRGNPVYYRKEGLILPFRADKTLLRLADSIRKLYAKYGIVEEKKRLSLDSSHWLMSRGKRVITISSIAPGSSSTSHLDDYLQVDPRSLNQTYEFIMALLENIDRR